MVELNQIQKIELDEEINEDMSFDLLSFPHYFTRWFTNNIISRSFSYLVGKTRLDKYKFLRCTEAGALLVAVNGAGYEFVDVKDGIAGQTLSEPVIFDAVQSMVRVTSLDYDYWLVTSPDGVNYNDSIFIVAGSTENFELVVKSFKVQRVSETNDAEYHIEGFR